MVWELPGATEQGAAASPLCQERRELRTRGSGQQQAGAHRQASGNQAALLFKARGVSGGGSCLCSPRPPRLPPQ